MSKSFFLVALAGFAGLAVAGPFGNGNLVVVRVGDGTTARSGAANAVFLDEYTTAGTLVQSIPMPNVAGGTGGFTLSGTATSEGALALSADGRFITLGGYAAALGTATVSSSSSASVARVAARVDMFGTIDLSTTTTSFSGASIRGVVTDDGTNFWMTGGNGGVRHTTFGGSGDAVQINTAGNTSTNLRNINIYNGDLYFSSASASLRGVAGFTGLPTSPDTATTLITLPSTPAHSPYDFLFVSDSTVYIADDSAAAGAGNLQRWDLISGVWTKSATFVPSLPANGLTRHVAGTVLPNGDVQMFITVEVGTGANSSSVLLSVLDSGGVATTTTLATAPAGTVFRGLEIVPAPGTLALLGLGGIIAGRRRR